MAIGCLVAGLALLGRPAETAAEVAIPRWDLPLRIAAATALVLLITSIASVIGPDLSGLAAAFPLFATVLGVFAHRHYSGPAARSAMRGLLLGLFGFAGFFATVSLLVTRTDVATAFTAALAVTLLIQGATLLVLRRARD